MDTRNQLSQLNNFYVYILLCQDNSLYTGWTDNLSRRLAAHNAGKGAKYTRCRLPVTMVYHETHPDKSAAMQREFAIKKMSRQQKLALCREYCPEGMK